MPILLFAQIRGDVLHDPNLGYALALGTLAITGVSNLVYLALRARSDRCSDDARPSGRMGGGRARWRRERGDGLLDPR